MAEGPLMRAMASGERARAEKAAPGFGLRERGRGHLLLTNEKSGMALVLDAKTMSERLRVTSRPNVGLVEAEDGTLLHLLVIEDRLNYLRMELMSLDGKVRWKAPAMYGSPNTTATLVVGDVLYIALFHRISTGAQLIAVNLATGALVWRADVVQMNVAHSQYWNDVSLEREGDRIVMHGYEASGCYTQTFALATGKRLSSTLSPPAQQP